MSVVKQMFAVLVSVGMLSSLVLAGTYRLTQPRIEENIRNELQEAIFIVLPEAKECERSEAGECKNIGTDALKVYKGLNDKQEPIGYAFAAEGPGFQGPIRMMVGIETDLDTLLGMKVLGQTETPGLGAKIAQETPKEDFYEQFAQLPLADITPETPATEAPDFVICLKTDDPTLQNDVQAITGATISSNAVASIINQHLMKLREIVPPTE